jgi:purine-cytosine permease-like protein
MKKSKWGEWIIFYCGIFIIIFFISELKGGFNRTLSGLISIKAMIPDIPFIAVLSFILVLVYIYAKKRNSK